MLTSFIPNDQFNWKPAGERSKFQLACTVGLLSTFIVGVVNTRMFHNYIAQLYVSDRIIPSNKLVDYTIDSFLAFVDLLTEPGAILGE